MATRRQAIMARYAELKEIRASSAATVAACENELKDLEDELRNTPADVLDMDAVARKNDALRRAGLLPNDIKTHSVF